MEKNQFLAALTQLRQTGEPRKFKQTIDLTINFKNIDFKKAENQVDVDVMLPHPIIGKGGGKVLLFVRDKEFARDAEKIVDRVMMEDEIKGINKKQLNELTNDYIGFLAEGPVMLTVGKFLGQTLAPKGKMPKPVTTDIKQVQAMVSRLKSVVKVSNKKGKFMPLVHISIGKEEMADEGIAENAMAIYQSVLSTVGGKETNIKSVLIKMTMSAPVIVSAKTIKSEAAA